MDEALKSQGLVPRYTVTKASGKPNDPGAEYFVLRLDDGGKDPKHVAACRKAILVYADAIEDHLPYLAADLRAKYDEADDEADDEFIGCCRMCGEVLNAGDDCEYDEDIEDRGGEPFTCEACMEGRF